MSGKKTLGLPSSFLFFTAVLCLFVGCRSAEPKAPDPSSSLELQLQQTKRTLSVKEEDNASLLRQLESAGQTREREQDELKKQFEEATAQLEERIAALSRDLSKANRTGKREKTVLREMQATLADAEEQRAAAVRELQDVKQFLAAKEREVAELANQLQAAKRVAVPKEPLYTKTQEPQRTMSDRQPILDKLAGIAPWVWISSAILIMLLLYLVLRQSNLSKHKGER